MGRTAAASAKAFYAANSGVEDALYQISLNPDYQTGTRSYDISETDWSAHIVVSGDDKQKTIESVGKSGIYVRKILVNAVNTSSTPGFSHAVLAGNGGFEMDGNTSVMVDDEHLGEETATVYSQGDIEGKSQAYDSEGNCKQSSSAILGFVFTEKKLTNLDGNGDGVCIQEEAHATDFEYCYIKGTGYGNFGPECEAGNELGAEEFPKVGLPNVGIDLLKRSIPVQGVVFDDDCVIGSGSSCYVMENSIPTIGNILITGNLIKPNAVNLNISGPVYVEGNIQLGSNSIVGLDDLAEVGQIVVAKHQIISSSNVTYRTLTKSGQEIFIMFVSDAEIPAAGDMCAENLAAINVSANAQSVLFYATKGCVYVNSTGSTYFHGAILGEKIHMAQNAQVKYDPDLQTAVFGLTKSGGWLITDFKEE